MISTERAKAAKELIARLLTVKRVCAQVHAVMHEVKDPPRRPGGKGKKRQAPTGDYLVQLFVGGRIPIPSSSDPGHDAAKARVNDPLLVLVKEVTASASSDIRELAVEAASLADFKRVDGLLSDLTKATTFQFYASDDALQPMDGVVTFRGEAADKRANQFCSAVNKHLTAVVGDLERELRRQIVEALGTL